jgi:hypothetical protein
MAGQITVSDWLVSVIKSRSFAYFEREDLKPFFYACKQHIIMLMRKLVKRLAQSYSKRSGNAV